MKKDDKITLITFFCIICLILIIIGYNLYKDKNQENVDRKLEYIFNTLTYDDVYNKGSELLNQAIMLLKDNKAFTYETNNSGKINYYAIGNYKEYKKITNFWLVTNTFSKEEITNFMNYKKIIKHENNYYIEKYLTNDIHYVGSIIDIEKYNDSYVYFTSTNYYCDNYDYLGVLNDKPNCNYREEESKFSIVLENNYLRINDLEEIKSIIN